MSFLDLDKINRNHFRSKRLKEEVFEHILSKCHQKIVKYNKYLAQRKCLFDPPRFVLGYPPYRYDDLINYLVYHLTNNGLKVIWLPSSSQLFISWDIRDQNRKLYQSNKKKRKPKKPIKSGPTIIPVPPSTSKKSTNNNPPIGLFEFTHDEGVVDYIPVSIPYKKKPKR